MYNTNNFNKSWIIGIVVLLVILLFPIQKKTEVTQVSWDRCIEIQEIRTFNRSGWSLPYGARLLYTRREFYDTEEVVDHYVTRTKQVPYTVYEEDGSHTEYRTETYEEAVYRTEYIYKTKYYYEIDEWTTVDKSISGGYDHKPYWNEDYELQAEQRDTVRHENYYITYVDSKNKEYKKSYKYDEWREIDVGSNAKVTTCLLGIKYKVTNFNR